jgi:hypothetical protein
MILRPEPPIAVSVGLLAAGLACFLGALLMMPLVPTSPFSFLGYAIPFAVGAGLLVAGFKRTSGGLRITFGVFLVPYVLLIAALVYGPVLRFLR